MAVAQLKQKETGVARTSLQQAISLQPDYPAAQVLGRLGMSIRTMMRLNIANDLQKTHPEAAYGDELTGDVLRPGRVQAGS